MCSREEYLKRYLAEDPQKGAKKCKSKRKISNKRESRFKIVDGDLDIKSLSVANVDLDDEYGDEAPIVTDIVDERPEYIRISELYDSTRWKKVENHTTDYNSLGQNNEDALKTTPNMIQSIPRDSIAAKIDDDMCNNRTIAAMQNEHMVMSHQQQIKILDSNKCVASLSSCNKKNSQCESGNDLYPDMPKRNKFARQNSQSDSDISPPREITTNSSHKGVKSSVKSHAESTVKNKQRECDSDVYDIGKLKYSVSRKSNKMWFDSNEIKTKQKSSVKLGVDSDGDLSPERIAACPNSSETLRSEKNRHLKQKTNNKRHDSESDSSYEHHQEKKSSFSKINKNLQNKKDVIIDKNVKWKEGFKCGSDCDITPLRRRTHESCNSHSFSDSSYFDSERLDCLPVESSISPEHITQKSKHHSKRKSDENHYSVNKKRNPTSTLSGMRAGLQDASTLRKEMKDLKNREQRMIHEIADEMSERTAETIVRDKNTGKRVDLEGERLKQKEKEKIIAEQQEKYMEWGKGMKQTEDRKEKLNEDCYEMTKPLARYRDDCDLERNLKEQLHSDDPMLQYMLKKRAKQQPNAHNVPAYSGDPAPPNRFNIKPGYRWDGVDRSNGFEKKCFGKHNDKKAFDEEAHKWSIQNM